MLPRHWNLGIAGCQVETFSISFRLTTRVGLERTRRGYVCGAHNMNGVPNPEITAVLLAFVVGGCGIWLLIRWFRQGPTNPDPWDRQVEEDLNNDRATPLCHRCLLPHDPLTNFCAQCGAPVGEYTNLLPYPCLFSIGHTMRIGASGEYRRSALTIFGFFLLSLAEYAMFAPVYWFVFLRNLRRPNPPIVSGTTSSP